jgi:hypothetical protein
MKTSRETNQSLRRHKLLPADIRRALPALYATDGDGDARAIVKFFCPYSNLTIFVFEFDGEDTLYTFTTQGPSDFGPTGEWGYTSFREIESASKALDRCTVPAIERECYPGTLPTRNELNDATVIA